MGGQCALLEKLRLEHMCERCEGSSRKMGRQRVMDLLHNYPPIILSFST